MLVSLVLASTWLNAGAPAKTPVPTKAAQDKALKLVLEVFQDDLQSAGTPAARVKLAAELLQQGRETKEDLALRYVLLREARNLAAEGGDAALAFGAIEEIDKTFSTDMLASKAVALAMAVEGATTKEAGKGLLDLTLPLIGEALDSDSYDAARLLGQVAEAAARKAKSPSLVLDAQKRGEEIRAAEKGFAKLQGYLDRLKAKPDDAEAQLALGKYYGLTRRNWDRALPYLAHGDNAVLKALAERDLTAPQDAVAQIALADAWWEQASQEKPASLSMQTRAAFWYDKAIGQLTGLSRTKAQKRLDIVAERRNGAAVLPVAKVAVGELKKFDGHTDEVKGVAFSHDGHYVASGSLDMTVRIWDVAAGKEEKTLRGHTKQVWAVAFHPNNRQLFSVSWDTSARLWDFKTGNQLRIYTHPLDVNGLALSRDGNSLVTACDDKNAYLWNVSTGAELRRFAGQTNFVYAVALAPDGRHIATGGVDRTVRIFELGTGLLVRAFDSQSNPITNLAFTNDSKLVFSAGDNVVHLWDVTTGKESRRFEGHNGQVPAMALSPDGKRLVTGGEDKTIRMWDVATGKELHLLKGHADTVTSLAYAHDGRRIVSGSLDRSVRVWGLPAR
jgi:outer membrane protein assembly factor BamB